MTIGANPQWNKFALKKIKTPKFNSIKYHIPNKEHEIKTKFTFLEKNIRMKTKMKKQKELFLLKKNKKDKGTILINASTHAICII